MFAVSAARAVPAAAPPTRAATRTRLNRRTIPSIDIDLGPDRHDLEDLLEVVIADPDAPVGDVAAQEPRVEGAMDEIPVPEPQGIVPQAPGLDAVLRVLGDGLPFFDERPVRLHPIGIRDLLLD